MPKNARILGIRLDDHTNTRLTRFENDTLIEGVSLARAALCAALDSYEENSTLSLPLKIVSATATSAQTTAIACANTAPSTVIFPPPPPTSKTAATIVKLPQPPVVGTLLHAAETTTTPPVTDPRRDVRYEKKRRSK